MITVNCLKIPVTLQWAHKCSWN